MTTPTIPTSGPARRRAKAIANRRRVHAADNNRRVASGLLPLHWSALDACPCGRVAWLEEGATDQDRDDFYRDSDDHNSYCDGGVF